MTLETSDTTLAAVTTACGGCGGQVGRYLCRAVLPAVRPPSSAGPAVRRGLCSPERWSALKAEKQELAKRLREVDEEQRAMDFYMAAHTGVFDGATVDAQRLVQVPGGKAPESAEQDAGWPKPSA